MIATQKTWLGIAAVAVIAVGLATALPVPVSKREARDPRPRLGEALAKTIATRGIDTAVADYRILRDQGFPGLRESEVDTNALGYRLLRQGDTAAAVRVLELNAKTHPGSANVHDSLGEAYLAAGRTDAAVESYRRAVAIDPRLKSAAATLQRLTSYEREPHPPSMRFHIVMGAVGLLSGAAAGSLRKGSRAHRLAGNVFVVSMMGMSSTGALIAFRDPGDETISVLMGGLTFYLVTTAWRAARRRRAEIDAFDWAGLLLGATVTAGLARRAFAGGAFGTVAIVFGAVALLALVGDVRLILQGGGIGPKRIARHLWRICAALYIAVMSFFMGQPQVFPVAVRESGVLVVPGLLVIVLMVYWLAKVLRGRAPKLGSAGGAPRPPLPTTNPTHA